MPGPCPPPQVPAGSRSKAGGVHAATPATSSSRVTTAWPTGEGSTVDLLPALHAARLDGRPGHPWPRALRGLPPFSPSAVHGDPDQAAPGVYRQRTSHTNEGDAHLPLPDSTPRIRDPAAAAPCR